MSDPEFGRTPEAERERGELWEGEYVVRAPLKIITEINRFLDGCRIVALLGGSEKASD